ncbi:hypothetical protein [Bradyrhizobium cosmicum]|uniref:Uncharacterized protein n=1 Tax=Bradyrhizobium cosmicum TaxID=1404864 RepID=A0AAI8MCG9_9BRAD|nr:hypothetical protein [Bradyrhizobium cosmicum]BAL76010.1 hypothetical protein S23_27980 [Bradyrhizobium cosmicum]
MNFSDAELAALESGVHNIGIFFRLDIEPEPVRLWLGFGDIKPGADVFDPAGGLYRGLGELKDVPAFKQLLNGAAERVEFTLSGVSGQMLDLASGDDAEAVKGRPVTLGFALMNERWALIGGLHWCAFYVADYLGGQQPATDDLTAVPVSTISLSCGTRFTGRRRPSYGYLSDKDQQARHPGDLSCSLILNYAHGFTKIFPVY